MLVLCELSERSQTGNAGRIEGLGYVTVLEAESSHGKILQGFKEVMWYVVVS